MCTEGVIIAAGQSKRMAPHQKLLLELAGQSILRRSIFAMLPYVSRITVVTGYLSDVIREHIHDIDRIDIQYNPNYKQGMFSSVIMGLSQMNGEHAFLLPADCPFIDSTVFVKLLNCNDDIVIPAYRGHFGHPVKLSHSSIQHLKNEQADSTLQTFIHHHPHRIIDVDCPGILMDIDTPQDYQRAIYYIKKKENFYGETK